LLGSDPPVTVGFVARLADSWEDTSFVKKAREDGEKLSFAGKEYYRSNHVTIPGTKDCICLVDQHTLLGGPEPTLKKMLEAKDAKSPLRDRLPKVDLGHDFVATFVMEQAERKDGGLTVRKALGEVLKHAKDNPAFEGADKLAEQIAAVTLSL